MDPKLRRRFEEDWLCNQPTDCLVLLDDNTSYEMHLRVFETCLYVQKQLVAYPACRLFHLHDVGPVEFFRLRRFLYAGIVHVSTKEVMVSFKRLLKRFGVYMIYTSDTAIIDYEVIYDCSLAESESG